MKSLRELYRIGFGPSSSHTMGPYRAAERFFAGNISADRFEVALYGSLAATGKGHFTDQAVRSAFPEGKCEILWYPQTFLEEHPNGMIFRALNDSGEEIDRLKIFSVGGGALSENGCQEDTPECYPYRSMSEMLEICTQQGISLWQLAEEFENLDFLDDIYAQMVETLKRGLSAEGVLPGGLQLPRKARSFYLKAQSLRADIQRTGLIAAYAYAVSEENASLGKVVTAPTCGSCGVLPAVLFYLQKTWNFSGTEIRQALATAGMVGNIVKSNGSISGAEVGCQGEIGTACAMASSAAAYLLGGTPRQCECAAEIGLEHFLGLTCDPVAGLVQIPCIERNSVAANQALVAAELALISDGHHFVSFDDVVKTMLTTGHDLPSLYRETSVGGLAEIMRNK